jgi:stage III sporulation protein AF
MTAWLSGWLKDIVLILLFATFVDLLIPNNSFQRYVKVVVSLIILLTILSPVISLLKAESDVRRAISFAEGSADSGIPPLASILEKGGRLKEDVDAQSAELVRTELEEMIRNKLVAQYPVDQADVHVALAVDSKTGQAHIARIRLILTDKLQNPASGNQRQSSLHTQSEKIMPVHVEKIEQVHVVTDQKSKADDAAQSEKSTSQDSRNQDGQSSSSVELQARQVIESQIKLDVQNWLLVEGRYIEIQWSESLHEAANTRDRIGGRQS